jgi:hypothetical protein
LRDANIQVPVEVDERAVPPEFTLDLLARQDLARILRKQAKRLKLLGRQLDQHSTAPQFVGFEVQLERSKAEKERAGFGGLHGFSIKPGC